MIVVRDCAPRSHLAGTPVAIGSGSHWLDAAQPTGVRIRVSWPPTREADYL
jgi:hypothetical protein